MRLEPGGCDFIVPGGLELGWATGRGKTCGRVYGPSNYRCWCSTGLGIEQLFSECPSQDDESQAVWLPGDTAPLQLYPWEILGFFKAHVF